MRSWKTCRNARASRMARGKYTIAKLRDVLIVRSKPTTACNAQRSQRSMNTSQPPSRASRTGFTKCGSQWSTRFIPLRQQGGPSSKLSRTFCNTWMTVFPISTLLQIRSSYTVRKRKTLKSCTPRLRTCLMMLKSHTLRATWEVSLYFTKSTQWSLKNYKD